MGQFVSSFGGEKAQAAAGLPGPLTALTFRNECSFCVGFHFFLFFFFRLIWEFFM